MYPFFLESILGDKILIPSYGLFLAIAFTCSYVDSIRRAIYAKLDPAHIENLFLICVVGSVLGSRGFHVLFENFAYFKEHPIQMFYFWQGGFTFYGAFIVAGFGMVYYAYKKQINIPSYSDIAAPSIALGLFIGRLGCLLAGCCWGRPTDLPWGISFNHPHSFASPLGTPLHPTQLYESLLSLGIYLYLLWRTKHRAYPGQVAVHGLAFYPIVRIFVEHFRGDAYRGFVLGGALSTSQFISALILLLAIPVAWYWKKNAKP